MNGEDIRAANARGTAPAQHSQEEALRLVGASLSHLAQGGGLIERCRDLRRRTPRDQRMLWLAARVISADSALGKSLEEAITPPRYKAKRKPSQPPKGELHARSAHSGMDGARCE